MYSKSYILSDKIGANASILARHTRAIIHKHVTRGPREAIVTATREAIPIRITISAQTRTRLARIEHELAAGARISGQTRASVRARGRARANAVNAARVGRTWIYKHGTIGARVGRKTLALEPERVISSKAEARILAGTRGTIVDERLTVNAIIAGLTRALIVAGRGLGTISAVYARIRAAHV